VFVVSVCVVLCNGAASAQTSDPDARHQTGPQPSEDEGLPIELGHWRGRRWCVDGIAEISCSRYWASKASSGEPPVIRIRLTGLRVLGWRLQP
jgi:hypothetical protein